MKKFIDKIKEKWLIKGTTTFLLIAILIAIFLLINILIQKLELEPIDFTEEKLYTLTQESKDKVKDVNKEVNIYFVGYSEEDSNLDLAKQYKKVNENINAESVDIAERLDIANKYQLTTDAQCIIVESGEKSKVLTASDLQTYDTTTYETINIAEEKLTSAIMSVSTDKIPKIYVLNGYGENSLSKNMNYFGIALVNEINTVEELNVVITGKIPDDCDILVVTTPSKDFDDIATNAIIEYINKGGNILWLNDAITENISMPNVQKILEIYGVKPFEIGYVRENDASKMISNSPEMINPNFGYSTITEKLFDSTGVYLYNATKINLVDDTELENLKVTKTELLKSSDKAYFTSDFNSTNFEQPETQEMLLGVELDKIVKEENTETQEQEVTSKLIIYGNNAFVTDATALIQNYRIPLIGLGDNMDLVLNSVSYLVDKDENITARKSTSTVTYTATQQEHDIVMIIIFTVPALIIIIGIIIWIVRKRRK